MTSIYRANNYTILLLGNTCAFSYFGGEGGIRTHARDKPASGLVDRPLITPWVPLHILPLFQGL